MKKLKQEKHEFERFSKDDKLNLELVTWNVQKMSVGTRKKREMRLLADHMGKKE